MKQDALKQPFFAKMLEAQRKAEHEESMGISKPIWDLPQTQKYPSDGDDDIPPVEA